MSRRIIFTIFPVLLICGFLAAAPAPAGVPKKKPEPVKPRRQKKKPSRLTAAEISLKALENTLSADFKAENKTLADLLAAVGKASGVPITLDQKLPKAVSDQQLTLIVPAGSTLKSLLGKALALSEPPLRYSVFDDGSIFVSTPLGVSRKAVSTKNDSKREAAVEPMSDAEILAELARAEGREVQFVHIDRPLFKVPSRDNFAPPSTTEVYTTVRPESPWWYYSSTPYFPRPELLWGRENQDMTLSERISAIVQLLEKNPDKTAKQILNMLH